MSREDGVVAIVGSREYQGRANVRRVVEMLRDRGEVTIISGGARGTDTFVRDACRDLGFHFCHEDPDPHGLEHLPLPHHYFEFTPDWRPKGTYNSRAGFDRNSEIVRHASRVIAFYAPGPKSSGTQDTVRKARKAGLPVSEFHEGRWSTP